MHVRLVKTAPGASAATGLTMGGRPPAPAPVTQPGLTFAQGFSGGAPGATRPGLRLAARNGMRLG